MRFQIYLLPTRRLLAASFTGMMILSTFLNASSQTQVDFDGDGRSDISVFRRSDQVWYIQKSSGGHTFIKWGNNTDNPVPGDYDDDGKTDIAIHRKLIPFPITGTWWILSSRDSTYSETRWASNNLGEYDTPVPADYDGDGKTDLAYFRRTDVVGEVATFFILPSSGAPHIVVDWGRPSLGDRPVPADYDGDGKADIAIYRDGQWWILQSSNGAVRIEQFGIATDKVVPGDFDGDGTADLAVWRPSNGVWYWRSSLNGVVNYVSWGIAEDKPVPNDFDGDGKTDIAVFRPSNGVWYILRSIDGNPVFHYFGLSDDVPIQNVYVR